MKVALALGSGGARGYAHIGAIRELEARGHEVVGLSGASMGAVVGGLYAAGKLDDLEEWFRSMNQRDVLRLLDLSFTGGGAIRANRVMSKIRGLCDGIRIEDLPIGYTAVASDLTARREVWFTRGPLDDALRASFAIPSIITPATVGGRHMVDGGVTNPVPMEPLATIDADLVMAVSLSGRRDGMRGSSFHESSAPEEAGEPGRESPEPEIGAGGSESGGPRRRIAQRVGNSPVMTAVNANMSGLGNRLRMAADDVRGGEFVRQLTARFAQQLDEDEMGDDAAGGDPADADALEQLDEAVAEAGEGAAESPVTGTLGLFDVVIQSIDTMESLITAYRMAGNPPDVLVDVPADICSAFDFHRADEVISAGRRLAAEQLDRAGL